MDIGVPPPADDQTSAGSLPGAVATAARPEGPAAETSPGAGASETTASAKPVFYRVDYRKVGFAEYWREHPKGIVLHAIRRLLRLQLPCASNDPCVESLAPFEVTRAAVPGTIVQRFSVAM